MRSFLAALLALALIPVVCLADPISGLPAASTLDGTELQVVVQGGVTKKATIANVAGVATAQSLQKASNLADLANASTARTALGLGAAATQPLSAFLQPGNNLSEITSATSARQVLKLPVVATSFSGVDPTGSTDSSAGLANALTAAAGAELDIPCGTFLVSSFAPAANTVVKGCSTGLTTLKRLGSATAGANPLVVVASGDDFENLAIDLNTPALGTVWSGIGPAGSTSGVTIRNVSIQSPSFEGVAYGDSNDTWTHANLILDNVSVKNAGWVGAYISNVNGGYARNVSITSTGGDGIETHRMANFTWEAPFVTKAVSPTILFNTPGSNPGATTSASSKTIASSGSFSFTTAASGLLIIPGQAIYAYSSASPSNYIYGKVTSYSGTALVFTATSSGGSGTFASWSIVAEGGGLFYVSPTNLGGNQVINPTFVDNRNSGYDSWIIGEVGTSSASTLTNALGNQNATIGANLEYFAGQQITFIDKTGPTGPTTLWRRGTVVSYNVSTGATVVNVTAALGASGSNWQVNTEPGDMTITGLQLINASGFGIDMQSNQHVIGADVIGSTGRCINFGLDQGGRVANANAVGLMCRNATAGWSFGDTSTGFQDFENDSLTGGLVVTDDLSTHLLQYCGVVNETNGTAFTNVAIDLPNYACSNFTTAAYLSFGGTDPRLNGAPLAFTPALTWTGGTNPTGATSSGSWDDHGSAKTRTFSAGIFTGSNLNGSTALTIGLPFTTAAGSVCNVNGQDLNSTTALLFGAAAASATVMTVVPAAGLTVNHNYTLSGSCQVQ